MKLETHLFEKYFSIGLDVGDFDKGYKCFEKLRTAGQSCSV